MDEFWNIFSSIFVLNNDAFGIIIMIIIIYLFFLKKKNHSHWTSVGSLFCSFSG